MTKEEFINAARKFDYSDEEIAAILEIQEKYQIPYNEIVIEGCITN